MNKNSENTNKIISLMQFLQQSKDLIKLLVELSHLVEFS